MKKDEFKKTKEFLLYSPMERIAYLLKLKYYCGGVYEDNYFDFVKTNDVSRSTVYKMECLISSVFPYDILSDIIKEGYELKPIDLNDHVKVKVLYNMLFMFMNDIKQLDDIPSYLVDIYKVLEHNVNIVKSNYLPSVGTIFDNMTDPYLNDDFLRGWIYLLEHGNPGNSYLTASVFLEGDKYPREERFTVEEDWEFLASYMKDMIDKTIEINRLPEKQRKKYRGYIPVSEKGIKALEKLTLDDYKKLVSLPASKRDSMIRSMFPAQEECFYKVLDDGLLVKTWTNDHYGGSVYSNRIYLHCGQDNMAKRMFFKTFVLKCIDNGISYNLKVDAGGDSKKTKDSSVIYVRSVEDIPVVFRILDEIKREHPEWIDDFGSPLWGCGQYNDSYYSIGFMGEVKGNNAPYTDKDGKRGYYLTPGTYTHNGITDRYLKDAYKIYLEKLNSSSRKLSEDEKMELFRRILYRVKVSRQKEPFPRIVQIGKNKLRDGYKLNSTFQAIVDMYSEDMPIHENGACDILTDCYIQAEKKEIELIDKIYYGRNMGDNIEVKRGKNL